MSVRSSACGTEMSLPTLLMVIDSRELVSFHMNISVGVEWHPAFT